MSQLQGLVVPGAYRDAFRALAVADQSAVDDVAAQMRHASFDRASVTALLDRLVGEQASALLDGLLSLLAVKRYLHLDDPEPLAVQTSELPELELTVEQRAPLRGRVDILLRTKTLRAVDRAQDLLREVPTSFVDARIITDIRPLFVDEPPATPSGAIITQTLRLEYRSEYGSREVSTLFIALDDASLRTIRIALDRAADKMTSLKNFLGGAGLSHVELSLEETRPEENR